MINMGPFTYYVINIWPISTPSVITFTAVVFDTITCSVIICKPSLRGARSDIMEIMSPSEANCIIPIIARAKRG